MTFRSTAISQSGDDITITGDLTMKGVTKSVTLTGEYSSPVKDPWGNQRAAVNVSAKINRKDWGLEWNMALETGGVVVINSKRARVRQRAYRLSAMADSEGTRRYTLDVNAGTDRFAFRFNALKSADRYWRPLLSLDHADQLNDRTRRDDGGPAPQMHLRHHRAAQFMFVQHPIHPLLIRAAAIAACAIRLVIDPFR